MSVSHTKVKNYETIARFRPVTKKPSEGDVSYTGAPYEITEDIVARLKAHMDGKRGRRVSQGAVARELRDYLRRRDGVTYKIDQSSISNITTKRYPSSRFAGPLADMYGWPRPPVARIMTESETMENAEKLERLRAARPDQYTQIILMLDGHLLQVEGEEKIAQAASILGEGGVRKLDRKGTPDDNR